MLRTTCKRAKPYPQTKNRAKKFSTTPINQEYDTNHRLDILECLYLRYALQNILMAKKEKYNVKFRIWFYSGDNKFLGIGRVELLERIKATGSIANAAKEMKMSYRQAWQMVAEMNERSSSPLVEKQRGGESGGGAVVTQSGIQAIETFHTLENKVRIFIENETKKLKL